jgi:hypothetical protein
MELDDALDNDVSAGHAQRAQIALYAHWQGRQKKRKNLSDSRMYLLTFFWLYSHANDRQWKEFRIA